MKHFPHYAILVVMLGLGVFSFFLVRPNTTAQLAIAVITAVAYVAWGIIHHWLDRDLHLKVVIEYVLIAAIAIVLLVTKGGI